MSAAGWIESAKTAASFDAVATALGMTRRGRGYGPCPACKADARSSSDARGPVGNNGGAGWKCWACEAKGDVVDLVAYATQGRKVSECSGDALAAVRQHFQAAGWIRESESAGARRRRSPPSGPSAQQRSTPAAAPEPVEEPIPGGAFAWYDAIVTECAAALWAGEQDDAPDDARAALAYLSESGERGGRGLSYDAIRFWRLGLYRARYESGQSLGTWISIPVFDRQGVAVSMRFRVVPGECNCGGYSKCPACKGSGVARKAYRPAQGRPLALFGAQNLHPDPATPLVIAEGELDVVALWDLGVKHNVVSGTGGAGTFASKPEWLDAIEPYRDIVLCLDQDDAGNEGAATLADKLGRERCSRARLPRKDAGECLAGTVDAAPVDPEIVRAAIAHPESMLGIDVRTVGTYFDELESMIADPTRLRGRPSGSGKLDAALGGLRGGLVVVTGESGHGKAQPVGEIVLTPQGWREIGSLAVGDLVISGDGTPTRVIGVYPQGERDIVEVRFRDGASVKCDVDHLWSVQSDIDVHRGKAPRVMSIGAISVNLHKEESLRWRIPTVRVKNDPRRFDVHPYVLGVLLGDGSLTNGARFTSADQEIIDNVRARLPVGYDVKARPSRSKAFDCMIGRGRTGGQQNVILEACRRLGIFGIKSESKSIPDVYMHGSESQRMDLLRGLLDTDGFANKAGEVLFCTSSPALAAGVRDLVASLGGSTRTSSKAARYKHHGEIRAGLDAYQVSICLPPDLQREAFSLARKRDRVKERYLKPCRKIESVTPAGRAECVCIAVEHPSRLYVTRGYAVTHNTTWATWLCLEQARLGIPTMITSFEQRPIGSVMKLLRTQVGTDFAGVSRDERRAAFDVLDKLPLRIVHHRGHMPIGSLVDTIKRERRRNGVRTVLVDHLGFLIDADGEDDRKNIESLIRELSIFGEHEDITIMLVAHPNNQAHAQQRRVTAGDLKGASAIRQDAHDILVVERLKIPKTGGNPAVAIHCDKIRSEYGLPGSKVVLAFDPMSCSYADRWDLTPAGKRGVPFVVDPSLVDDRKARTQTKSRARAQTSQGKTAAADDDSQTTKFTEDEEA